MGITILTTFENLPLVTFEGITAVYEKPLMKLLITNINLDRSDFFKTNEQWAIVKVSMSNCSLRGYITHI
jgi:hypothetical protein